MCIFEIQCTSSFRKKAELAGAAIELVRGFIDTFNRNPSIARPELLIYYKFIGENYARLCKVELAYECFLKAEAAVESDQLICDKTTLMNVYANLGRCEWRLGMREKALSRIDDIHKMGRFNN